MVSKSQSFKLPQPYPASQLNNMSHINFNSKRIIQDLLQATINIRQDIQLKRDLKITIKELRGELKKPNVPKDQNYKQKLQNLQNLKKKQSTINTVTYKLSFTEIQIPFLILKNKKQLNSSAQKNQQLNINFIQQRQSNDKKTFQDKQFIRKKNRQIAKLMVAQSLNYEKKSITASGQAYVTLSVNSIYPAYILKYDQKNNHQACFIQFNFKNEQIKNNKQINQLIKDSQEISNYLGLRAQQDFNYLLVYPINYSQRYNNQKHFNHLIAILISEQLRFNTLVKISEQLQLKTLTQKQREQLYKKLNVNFIFDKLYKYLAVYQNWEKISDQELNQYKIKILLRKLDQ